MASGVGIDDSVISTFNELKLGHNFRYMILSMNADNTKIVVEKTAPSDKGYKDFTEDLPKDECRYAIYDLAFQSDDGGDRSKLVFVSWSPDNAKTKSKMLYTSSKLDLRRALVGIAVEVQATDASEIDEQTIVEKVKRSSK